MSWTYGDIFGPLDLFVCVFPDSVRWAIYFLMQGVFSYDGRKTKNLTSSVMWYKLTHHNWNNSKWQCSVCWVLCGVWGRWHSWYQTYLSHHGSLTGWSRMVSMCLSQHSQAPCLWELKQLAPRTWAPGQLLYFTVRRLDKLKCILILLFSSPLI